MTHKTVCFAEKQYYTKIQCLEFLDKYTPASSESVSTFSAGTGAVSLLGDKF
jgi:hypothetical protein